jgi:hypothetical protein
LETCQAEITNLQVAVFVYQDVAGFEIAMYDAGRVDVFQATQNLIEEVLYELLLERSGCEESM